MTNTVSDPREVGKTYYSNYWRMTYKVLKREEYPDGTVWFVVRWEDGETTTHCTAYDPRDKEVVK